MSCQKNNVNEKKMESREMVWEWLVVVYGQLLGTSY